MRKSKYLVFVLSLILFFLPFFWLHPQQVDIGGDSNRLYFYDPRNNLISDSLYIFEYVLEGKRSYAPHFYLIPYIFFLWLGKSVIDSGYFWISVSNGIKLSLSFLFVSLIIQVLLRETVKNAREKFLYIASVLGGIFYIVAPIVIGNYDKALITHNQVFLNPLIFYLFLLFFLKKKFRYLVFVIVVTILFSPNFSWAAAPPFFAFFPISLLFLCIFVLFIKKQKINFPQIFIFLLLLVGLHGFHLLPEIISVLNPGSGINERVFDINSMLSQINYFYGVLPSSKLSYNLFSYLPIKLFAWLGIIPITFVVFGFIFNEYKNKLFVLTGIFFLICLYLVSANITASGIKLYELFFYIPGFSMFRNFIGQWAFVYSFFYAILFGQALYIVLQRIRNFKAVLMISFIIFIALVIGGWKFFIGDMVNVIHFQSNEVKVPMKIDPKLDETLSFVRSMKDDGAFISLPFTDCCYSVIHGVDNGAYVGTSPITELTGKKDFNGYITIAPFSEVLLDLMEQKQYEDVERLLGLLNIKYIYFNDDYRIYDDFFPGYPYTSMRAVFPTTQDEYAIFVKRISNKEIYKNGHFRIYEAKTKHFNPRIFLAESVIPYENTQDDWYGDTESFFLGKQIKNIAYLDKVTCERNFISKDCEKEILFDTEKPEIIYKKIDPTLYQVRVKNAKKPYMLVFSTTFHQNWKLSVSSGNIFHDKWMSNYFSNHMLVNGYANAWLVDPEDVDNKRDYVLTIQMIEQRYFYIGIMITCFSLVLFFLVIFLLFRKRML